MPHKSTDTQVLADSGRAHLAAQNGHHRRWAAKRCVDALVAQGAPPSIAANCATAMASIAQAIAAKAVG